jgi:hypothetical protein
MFSWQWLLRLQSFGCDAVQFGEWLPSHEMYPSKLDWYRPLWQPKIFYQCSVFFYVYCLSYGSWRNACTLNYIKLPFLSQAHLFNGMPIYSCNCGFLCIHFTGCVRCITAGVVVCCVMSGLNVEWKGEVDLYVGLVRVRVDTVTGRAVERGAAQ